jgi:hypothetical protein
MRSCEEIEERPRFENGDAHLIEQCHDALQQKNASVRKELVMFRELFYFIFISILLLVSSLDF